MKPTHNHMREKESTVHGQDIKRDFFNTARDLQNTTMEVPLSPDCTHKDYAKILISSKKENEYVLLFWEK